MDFSSFHSELSKAGMAGLKAGKAIRKGVHIGDRTFRMSSHKSKGKYNLYPKTYTDKEAEKG